MVQGSGSTQEDVQHSTQTEMSQQDILTQVQPEDAGAAFMAAGQDEYMDDYNTEIRMNMRGHMFTITRDDLMALPESILLCLFPNGIFVGMDGNVITNLTEDDIVYVNFAPECFQYICQVFDTAVRDLHVVNQHQQQYYDINDPNILNERPSIIVLREDLDYYCIPPVKNLTVDQMRHVKLLVGEKLLQFNNIFQGLGYVAGKQLRPAEQHLMDMLCSSGFNHDELWGHRSLEPGKTVIFSLTLARLNNNTVNAAANAAAAEAAAATGGDLSASISGTATPSNESIASTDERGRNQEKRKSRLTTLAQSISRAGSRSRVRNKGNPNNTKLLLFWRKPARKCWWSNNTIEVDIGDIGLVDADGKKISNTLIKVHIRRVWTLELSIIGVQ